MLNWLKSLSPNGHSVLIGVGGVVIGFAIVLGAQFVMHGAGSAHVAIAKTAAAQTSQATRQPTNQCKQIIQAMCGNVELGGERIKNCMRDHLNDLATDCRATIEARLAPKDSNRDTAIPGPRFACKQDARSLCSDVQPGGGRIIQCLRSHADQLESGCRRTVERLGGNAQSRDRNLGPL
jgi:hypothetical protein